MARRGGCPPGGGNGKIARRPVKGGRRPSPRLQTGDGLRRFVTPREALGPCLFTAFRWYLPCSGGPRMRRVLSLSLAQPLVVLALTALFAVAGAVAFWHVPMEAFPERAGPQ